jgi:magnesium transporter
MRERHHEAMAGEHMNMTKQIKRRIPRIRMRHAPGTQPGLMVAPAEAMAPKISLLAYGPQGMEELKIERIEEIEPFLKSHPVTWINVEGLGDVDLIRAFGERFGMHKLALEDVFNTHQRPKIEPYDEHLFIIVRIPRHGEHLDTEQISTVVGKGFVLTFQETHGDCFDPVRKRIRNPSSPIRERNAGYLAYALIDATVDNYFPLTESIGDRIEDLEERVLTESRNGAVGDIHRLKRDLIVLRRAVWPTRDLVSAILRDESPIIDKLTRVYLRDAADHATQLIDLIETYRELSGGLLDTYFTLLSNRMNDIMKVLTIFAAIFIPLTFMAGLYGMNFEHMPELAWRYSYPALLLAMAVAGVGMLLVFRHKGWLGGGDRH